jgi:acyl-CoA thioester hydrolase
VAEATCRYRFPARFDDEVIVRTWVAEANTRMAIIAYEMRLAGEARDEGGMVPGDELERPSRMLATGQTRHVFVSRDFRRVRLPEKYHAMFGIAEPQR